MIILIAEIMVAICLVGIVVLVARKLRSEGGPRVADKTAESTRATPIPIKEATALSERLEAFGKILKEKISRAAPIVSERLKAFFSRLLPLIKGLAQNASRLAMKAWQKLAPVARNASRQTGYLLKAAAKRGAAGLRAGGKYINEQIQAASDTMAHIKMRQKEHAARMKEKEKFLGDLMTKVQQKPSAPVRPPEPPVKEQPVAAIKEKEETAEPEAAIEIVEPGIKPARKARWQFFEQFKGQFEEEQKAVAGEVKTEGAPNENDQRTRVILREQEQIILKQVAKNPKDIALYKRLGFVYVELGERVDAKLCFEQAIKLGSQDPIIKRELQVLNQALGGVK